MSRGTGGLRAATRRLRTISILSIVSWPPVLEPSLDLRLSESEGPGQLHALRGGEVALGGEPGADS